MIYKEPSTLGKFWWNREDIPSLQSITIPYLAVHHEAHIMEYQRAQRPKERHNIKKYADARKT